MRPRHFIRRWREHAGLSQEQLAEAIGKERSYVSRIENGRRRYDEQFLEATALALNCSIVDLIARDPVDPEGLWAIYDRLSPKHRRQLVEMAKIFLESEPAGYLKAAEPEPAPFETPASRRPPKRSSR
jgi:transcriptional regulator with XRE-family HTH domain